MKEIIDGLSLWQTGNYNTLLTEVDYITISLNEFPNNLPIHVYPAVFNDIVSGVTKPVLKFVLISEMYDQESRATLERVNVITPYPYSKEYRVTENLLITSTNAITKDEALLRINNWKKDKKVWVGAQLPFKALEVPITDLSASPYQALFGLKTVESNQLFDFVLTKDHVNFYDNIRQIPPFKPENFYLLTLI